MEIQVLRGLVYRIRSWGDDRSHSKPLPGHGTYLGHILKTTQVPPNLSLVKISIL